MIIARKKVLKDGLLGFISRELQKCHCYIEHCEQSQFSILVSVDTQLKDLGEALR